jgi:hypothetical protein
VLGGLSLFAIKKRFQPENFLLLSFWEVVTKAVIPSLPQDACGKQYESDKKSIPIWSCCKKDRFPKKARVRAGSSVSVWSENM